MKKKEAKLKKKEKQFWIKKEEGKSMIN